MCCESRCGGTCERCNLAGRAGFCDPIPNGDDPDNECDADSAASCGKNGTCSGARTCALHPAGTTCHAAFCGGQVSNPADTCDGLGACVDNGTRDCAPYVCVAATGACKTTCATNADCQSDFECAGNTCKKSRASTCAADSECASGFCADNVCCDARCGGTCEKCTLAGRAGYCDPIPNGQDPDDECPTDASSTCGRTGACGGQRACALYSSGAVCQAAVCQGGVSNFADTCSGNGVCVDGGTQTCAPFACNDPTGLCRSACVANTDCASGYTCLTGTGMCKKARGTACGADFECASASCTDGVCCESRCDGQCEKCSLSGRAGFCDAIASGTDPDGECAADPTSTCQQNGQCSGQRKCALHPRGTVCLDAFCLGDTLIVAETCDGNGNCVENGDVSCAPLACDPGSSTCR